MDKQQVVEERKESKSVADTDFLSVFGGFSVPPEPAVDDPFHMHVPDAETATLYAHALDTQNVQRYFCSALSGLSVLAPEDAGPSIYGNLARMPRGSDVMAEEDTLYDLIKTVVATRRTAIDALREEVQRRVRLLSGALLNAGYTIDLPSEELTND